MLTNAGSSVPPSGDDDQQNVTGTPADQQRQRTGPAGALFVPHDLDPDADALTLALALAAAGFYVLPTRAGELRHAGSVLGKGWPGKTSRDPGQVAAWFAGTDHRVGVHCGRSGVVAFDVDHADGLERPEAAALARAIAEEAPPFHGTRLDPDGDEFDPERGHYLFRVPPGRSLTNSNGELGRAWGEVRGNNGIIVVGGHGRMFVQTGEVPVLPEYLAALLPDGGDRFSTVSDDELARFVVAHPLETSPGRLVEILTGFGRVIADGGSRHQALVGAACWATREVVKGRLGARATFRRLADEFAAVMATPPRPGDRTMTRRAALGEARSVIAWAVAQEGGVSYSEPLDRLSSLGSGPEPAPSTKVRPEADPTPTGLLNAGTERAPDLPLSRVDEPDAIDDDDTPEPDPEVDPEQAIRAAAEQVEFEAVLRRERILARARQQLRADLMERPRRMSGREFLAQPGPVELVPHMLYRDSLCHMFGPPGGGKSFLILDLALRIANGMTWGTGDQQVRLPAGDVHYVMAEGAGVNVARLHAWLAHHQRDESALDRFHPWPMPVLLTEAGLTHYLREVERDKPALVILDTKNAMMDGDENSGSDTAVLVRAMHLIRVAAGGACVLLVDHTGKRDTETSRGSNAVKAASDTQVRVMRDDDTKVVEVRITRDKAAEAGTSWSFEIRGVPQVDKGAVLVPATGRDGSPFRSVEPWWAFDVIDLADAVRKMSGRGADSARDCYRVMCWVADRDGMTAEQVYRIVRERPGEVPADATLRAGFARLKSEGIVVQGSTPTRFVVSEHYMATRSTPGDAQVSDQP